MTSIVIPVSTPGAGESADALSRAAAAVLQLAKGLDQERIAAAAVSQARKTATDAAKAMTQADRERVVMVKATTQALKDEAAQARIYAEQETRDIIAQRAKLSTSQKIAGDHQGGGYASGIRRHAGMVGGAITGGTPDIGSVAGGLLAGGSVAVVAAGAAAIGMTIAAVSAAMKHAEEAAISLAADFRRAGEITVEARNTAGSRAGAAMDSNGALLIAAQSRNPNALAAASASAASLPGVSAQDALSFEKQGLTPSQKKAAAMAAAITGGSPADYGEKLRSVHLNMSSPEQMASFLLSQENRFLSPAETASAYSSSQSQAGDINSRTQSKAASDLSALSPSAQKDGARKGLLDKQTAKREQKSSLSAAILQNKEAQARMTPLEEAAAEEGDFSNYFRDVARFFGSGAGSYHRQLKQMATEYDKNQIKLVIPSGMAR